MNPTTQQEAGMDHSNKVPTIRANFFKSQERSKKVGNIFIYLLLILVSIILMLPLVWMVSTSLKPMTEIAQFPPTLLPETVQWENYIETIRAFPFFRYAWNTLTITFFVVLGMFCLIHLLATGLQKLTFQEENYCFHSFWQL